VKGNILRAERDLHNDFWKDKSGQVRFCRRSEPSWMINMQIYMCSDFCERGMGQPWLRVKISALGEVSSGNKGHRNGVEWSNLRVVDTSRQQKQKENKKSKLGCIQAPSLSFQRHLTFERTNGGHHHEGDRLSSLSLTSRLLAVSFWATLATIPAFHLVTDQHQRSSFIRDNIRPHSTH
jgi:hypothetical protein